MILFALVGNGTGRISPGFLMSCLRGLTNRKLHLLYVNDGPYIGRARNAAASYFITKTKLEWLLFIDMDIVFDRRHIDLLFESKNEPIVAGLFFLKLPDKLQPAAIKLDGVEYKDGYEGLVAMKRVATGFMRIHREVFEVLRDDYAEPYKDYEGNPQWNFFPQEVYNDELVSEDWGFCDLARLAGFDVMLDTRIKLLHEGNVLFPLSR